jgi:hypothetical protein
LPEGHRETLISRLNRYPLLNAISPRVFGPHENRMRTEWEDLRDNAERCRRLAAVVEDEKTKQMLEGTALQFEQLAAALAAKQRAND